MTYVLIGLGGFLGANARYALSVWAAGRFGTAFPYGTLIINISGSFLMGIVLTLIASRFPGAANARLLMATGFLGAYTTFSTFAYETLALLRQRDWRGGLLNYVGSVMLGAAAAALGIGLTHRLLG